MNVLLDPYILAVPNPSDGRTIDYLEGLYKWTVAISEQKGQRFWLSQPIVDVLWDANLYPTWSAVAHLENDLPDDKSLNVNTALRACERYIVEPPLLDAFVGNASFYFEKEQVVVIPDAVARRLPNDVADALRETLALAALGRQTQAHEVFENLLFATVPNGFQEKYLKAEMETLYLSDEADDEQQHIAEEWEMIFSPDELDDIEGLLSFWEDTERALTWARRKVQAEGHETDNMAKHIVGARFNASIRKTHLNEHPAVLSTLFIKTVKMLCGVIPRFKKSRYHDKSTPNHPIKKGGEVVTRQDDGAKAYRLSIQGQWRLHYWLLEDGAIELANVDYGHTNVTNIEG